MLTDHAPSLAQGAVSGVTLRPATNQCSERSCDVHNCTDRSTSRSNSGSETFKVKVNSELMVVLFIYFQAYFQPCDCNSLMKSQKQFHSWNIILRN